MYCATGIVPRSSHFGFGNFADGHFLRAHHPALFIGSRQQKQVLDQRSHAVRLGEQGVACQTPC